MLTQLLQLGTNLVALKSLKSLNFYYDTVRENKYSKTFSLFLLNMPTSLLISNNILKIVGDAVNYSSHSYI